MSEIERKIVDGELFVKMVLGGAKNLQANLQEVNDLNVFPIPDGDTGENMYLTLQGGLERLKNESSSRLCDKASAMAQGMLLGARGNSGVILSQLFYGLAEGLLGLETADVRQLGSALKHGVKCAYGAVAHPVEGTILTVAREAVEEACARYGHDVGVEEFFSGYLTEMKISLEKTPNLLAVLKEAGVIDSGGAGLVYITEGFCKALGGEETEHELALSSVHAAKSLDFSKFDEHSVMQFGYCTELLLQLQACKTDVEHFSVPSLIEFLESVGDSIVAFQTGTVVKIHVHTMEPYKVLQHCQSFGEFLTVKIENMTLQHNETVERKTTFKKPRRARRKYATVTVVSGEGLIATFKEMGADYVIAGGQTNNPSAEDFLAAFDEVNADHIFVLPNNGNVILAAKQAAGMYEGAEIYIIASKTVGQGYSALSMLDYSADDPDAIAEMMTESMSATVTAMVARAVRDSELGGVKIVKDQYMGFADDQMYTCEKERLNAATSLCDKLELNEKAFLIAVYGKTVTEGEKAAFNAYMGATYPHIEVYGIDGKQEIYDFIMIIE